MRFDQQRTILDEGPTHLVALELTPRERLWLPEVDTTGARFLSLFYSRDVVGHEGDHTISILALPGEGGLLLFPDLNNDEDLRNDGPPRFLADSIGVLTFALSAPNDPLQLTHRVVQHVPTSVRSGLQSQEWFDGMTDEAGNLRPIFANLWGISGARGSYLFDDRPVLARGVLQTDEETLAVGIYDFNGNGLYDDVGVDVLIVDVDGDGELVYGKPDPGVFHLDEVFEVGEQRFRLADIDPYGGSIRVVEVSEPATEVYLDEQQKAFEAAEFAPLRSHSLDSTFWSLELPTIGGGTLRLSDFRGKPLLLNVWGEWCGPCLVEMPELVKADDLYSQDVQILGILSTGNVDAAQSYLNDVGARWPQALITDQFRDLFDIRFYPTNLFISSASATAEESRMVNLRYVEKRVGLR